MKQFLFLLMLLTLASCQRGCSEFNRSVQTGELDYEITVYSGGDTVFYDKFRGIVNNSESSDGVYYYKLDTLIEISGDYILKAK